MRRWGTIALPALVVVAVVVVVVITLGRGEREADPIDVAAAGPRFSSIAEMTDAADLVVEAVVVSSDDGRRITDPADPGAGVVTRLYELEVIEVFRGEVGGFVLVEQEAALLDGTPIVVNGLTPHEIGDTAVWFLVLGESEDFPFSAVVNEQGRLLISPADRIEGPLVGGTVDAEELRDVLRSTS